MSGAVASGAAAVLRGLRAVHWYLRELTGESAYDRHCERHLRMHPELPPPSPREFQRLRTRQLEEHPQSRCC
ncbi:YbdD/YjiX family protein [Streptomyces sp. NPDC001985]|uniref:YbdD/YjiX family protein n=1 Tax=Streptomyces sp. NPDC001985 TaxID=3154406 RepID=UPI003324145F